MVAAPDALAVTGIVTEPPAGTVAEPGAEIVTLTGVVETQHQKDKATKLAKKVKGVKNVVNNITLKERSAAK